MCATRCTASTAGPDPSQPPHAVYAHNGGTPWHLNGLVEPAATPGGAGGLVLQWPRACTSSMAHMLCSVWVCDGSSSGHWAGMRLPRLTLVALMVRPGLCLHRADFARRAAAGRLRTELSAASHVRWLSCATMSRALGVLCMWSLATACAAQPQAIRQLLGYTSHFVTLDTHDFYYARVVATSTTAYTIAGKK